MAKLFSFCQTLRANCHFARIFAKQRLCLPESGPFKGVLSQGPNHLAPRSKQPADETVQPALAPLKFFFGLSPPPRRSSRRLTRLAEGQPLSSHLRSVLEILGVYFEYFSPPLDDHEFKSPSHQCVFLLFFQFYLLKIPN